MAIFVDYSEMVLELRNKAQPELIKGYITSIEFMLYEFQAFAFKDFESLETTFGEIVKV